MLGNLDGLPICEGECNRQDLRDPWSQTGLCISNSPGKLLEFVLRMAREVRNRRCINKNSIHAQFRGEIRSSGHHP